MIPWVIMSGGLAFWSWDLLKVHGKERDIANIAEVSFTFIFAFAASEPFSPRWVY